MMRVMMRARSGVCDMVGLRLKEKGFVLSDSVDGTSVVEGWQVVGWVGEGDIGD